MAADDDENLDDILSSALEDFRLPSPPAAATEPTTVGDSWSQNTGGSTETIEEQEQRALEEALKSLNALNADGGDKKTDEAPEGASADEGVDMKLLEDFVKVLAEQPLGREKGGGSAASDENNKKRQGSDGLEGILEDIVGRLLSKEIFRGPMLQMRDAYASWIPENEGKVEKSDMDRYKKQSKLVEEICLEYEGEGNFENVMVLLESMQECGSPPKEIMTKLSAEGVDTDALGTGAGGIDPSSEQLPPELEKLNEQCKVQ